ncbi:MAG TPA: hypothetical protein DEP87_04675 [Candidatus Pacebacteria bacterium]|nr:hypothetical protein [Candidatus Paceibacterota bacterium]
MVQATSNSQSNFKKIRLALDGNEANVKNRVGSNAYAFEIIKALWKLTAREPQISVITLLSTPPIADLPPERTNWHYRVITPKPFWTQWALPLHLFWCRHEYDVLFTPGHYAPRISAIPYISSVMDLAFLKYPDSFAKKDYLQLKAWTEYSVKSAQKVVAISNFTKQEIRRAYHRLDNDIIVAPPSVTELNSRFNHHQFEKFCQKIGLSEPYFLYLGTLQPRKNLVSLIEAFEQIMMGSTSGVNPQSATVSDLKLVLAGKIGWLADEIIQKIAVSPVKNQIILTGFISNQLKYPLYSHATAALMLSPYEGFGIPALEAMAAGTLPIVANSSSLPEVVGKAGVLVNPNQVGSIANGLLQAFYMSETERATLKSLGKGRVKKFSWEASAKLILKELVSLTDQSISQ